MKKLLIINALGVNLENLDSNQYEDVANLDISDLQGNNLLEALYDSWAYILENEIKDVVFIAKNESYGDLTELFYMISTRNTFCQTYIVPMRHQKDMDKEVFLVENIMLKVDFAKPRLSEFQVHLNDNCNLNCKGCGHFCPIVTESHFLDAEKYDRDLCQMNQKFWGVGKIYLLGGEPLLHPQAAEFAAITRKRFPDADIRLYTNGLLLPKQNDEFWKIIKENFIRIELSLYAPTVKMFDKIEYILKKNEVWEDAILWENKQHFSKGGLLKSNGNMEKAYEECTSKTCHFLRDGYLAICPAVFLRQTFWKQYNIAPQYIPEENAVDLYDESITGWQILEYLKRPNEACLFCGTPQWYDWDTRTMETAEMLDWLVE